MPAGLHAKLLLCDELVLCHFAVLYRVIGEQTGRRSQGY